VRVAAVDLGTNSTRLLVADVRDQTVEEVARRLTITRLGEDVDGGHRLVPSAMARVRDCLGRYRRELEQLGAERTLAIGTSALRDAENGEAFLTEISASYGLTTRLLSGADEAELTLRGVSSDRTLSGSTLVVDIGGGSTELVLGRPGSVSYSTSLQLGCVRLTERFLASDPPAGDELEACRTYVRKHLPELEATDAIGVAGTVTTIAALDLALAEYDPARVHRHRMSRASVERELDRLAALTVAERELIPGIEPGRAPVIVAGAVILHELMTVYGLDEIEASERDILDGAVLAAAELPPIAPD
jgi:exopolyphosphatase/guanosine-5'-triphosphate,3'-diphosphate pyrophosphatase